MALATSLGQNGALPNPFGNTSSGIIGSINKATGLSSTPTPQANWYLPSTTSAPAPTASTGKVTGVLSPSNPNGVGTSAQNASVAPTASTAVKKTTTTDSLGNTNTTEYHAPESQPLYDTTNGFVTPYGLSQGAKAVQPGDPNYNAPASSSGSSSSSSNTTPPPVTGGTYTPPNQGSTGISQGGLISNAVNQSQTPNPIATTAGNNLNTIGGTVSPAVTEANQELENLKNEYAQKGINIQGTAGFLTQANGEQGLLNNQYQNAQANVQGKLSNALTEQGQQISASSAAGGIGNTSQGLMQSALGTAIGANAPVTQFGQLTNPITGAVVGAGTSGNNPALDAAVANAIQMVQNGASPQDAQASLSGYGQAGVNAFNQAQQKVTNGTYNPTAANAVANSNTSQAINYKQQAVDLDTSLQQLSTASTLAENFLNANNLLNPSANPSYNKGINTYIGTFQDPAAVLQYNTILGDIKKFTSTILASNNGTIPTDVTNTLSSFDPSHLSAAQLKPYLDSLAQLGNNQKSIIQGQINSLIPGQGGYAGSPTGTDTTPISTPQTNQNASTAEKGAIGTVMNIIGGVEGAISGLASKVLE